MPLPKDFKHIRAIGEGYFATVSKYHSQTRNESWAVKTLKFQHQKSREYRHRFLREIAILKDLKGHPHIVDLVDSEPDEDASTLWYAMPLAKENVHSFVKRENQNLNLEYRVSLFEEMLSALQHAHGMGILHRDISPSNALVFQDEDEVWTELSDFGLGKDQAAIAFTATSVGGFGQSLYVSPEQREQLKSADNRSDIYSLGKLLYFIINGKDPIDIRGGNFYTVIRRSIEERPQDRYQDIADFAREFTDIKNFLLAPGIPPSQLTMREYLDGKTDIPWKEFHQVALNGRFDSHLYHDYVSPVTDILTQKGNLEEYHRIMKKDFIHFVEAYNGGVDRLSREVGWPFSALSSFGDLNYRMIRLTKAADVQLRCLISLWDIAWDANQFSAQRQFRDLQTENEIMDEVITPFTEHLITNSRKRKTNLDAFLGKRVPPMLKRALQSLTTE
jgi:eukaryotic-like serine/threonine-protein kinase